MNESVRRQQAYTLAFDPNKTHIPLSTEMIKRVMGTPRIKAYHITDSKGFQHLQNLQGKKSLKIDILACVSLVKRRFGFSIAGSAGNMRVKTCFLCITD